MGIALGLQVVLTEYVGGFMGVSLGYLNWLKIFAVSFLIILFSEGYKFTIRLVRKNIHNLQKKYSN